MTIGKDKIEVFITAYLRLNCASSAYRLTYPHKAKRWKKATIHNAAYKLMKTEKVKLRLAEVRAELEEELHFGRRAAFEMYKEIYELGIKPTGQHDNMQLSAAKAAVDSMAKLFGLLVDKKEVVKDIRDDFEEQLKREVDDTNREQVLPVQSK